MQIEMRTHGRHVKVDERESEVRAPSLAWTFFFLIARWCSGSSFLYLFKLWYIEVELNFIDAQR